MPNYVRWGGNRVLLLGNEDFFNSFGKKKIGYVMSHESSGGKMSKDHNNFKTKYSDTL